MRRARGSGFTLLEVVFAVAITATALLALQATCGGAILSAADSINRRAARAKARGKMEELIVGLVQPDEGGNFEDNPEFTWTSTSEELTVGFGEAGTEKVLRVNLEVSFPVETGESGRETIRLSTLLPVAGGPPGAAGAAGS